MRRDAEAARRSPAFAIVAAACRAAVTGERDSIDYQPAHPGGDAILAMAMRHRVSTPVLRILARDPELDADAAARLLELARDRQLSALRLSAALVAVSQELSKAGIRHLVLKGPALSQRLYDDLAARDCKDIDIFIDPAARAPAEAAIADLGFRRTRAATPPGDPWRASLAPKDVSFRSRDGSIELELHDRLFDVAQLLPLSFDHFWSTHETLAIAGTTLPILSATDDFLYLCGHGALCGWFRLKWLQDIARILAAESPATLAGFADAADRLGVRPMTTGAATLVEQIFGLQLSDVIAAARSPASLRIVNRSREALAAPAAASNAPSIPRLARMLMLQLGLRRDWRYRREVLARTFLSEHDVDMVKLPHFARGLYYPLRPLLLALRRLRPRRS
ncbi:nucleotidyltransferase family protein [Sphingomonas asaccharolytica]|uniref:nucleotidyltransferase family protein n=1 Tax=Sphingomonas asaccharolytica TaxID=40681 RepID=UPI000A7EAC07|nr:nucleotidyltransferase family protein [Sphingomonas asaccharolytica]